MGLLRVLTGVFICVFVLCTSVRGEPVFCRSSLSDLDLILAPLSDAEKFLASTDDPEELLRKISSKEIDFRGSMFRMEAVTRVLKEVRGKKFENLWETFKEFEDRLGFLGQTEEAYEEAVKVKADPEAVEILKADLLTAKAEFLEFLKKSKWMGKSQKRIQEIRAEVRSLKPKDLSTFKWKYTAFLKDELKDLENLDYDMEELQEGLHEMRRTIRWILIEIQASRGVFLLKDLPVGESVKKYLGGDVEELLRSPFNQLKPNPQFVDPIFVPTLLFISFSKAINILGKIKTDAENREALILAYEKAGQSKESARQIVDTLFGRAGIALDTIRMAKVERQRILDAGFIKELRKYLKGLLRHTD